jgi:ribosomal protein S18 acetylase RimI-like enzyme
MNLELYFLRSSESKIVSDMIKYAYRLDETDKNVRDFPHLSIYDDFYGLSTKDLGIYAMADKRVAGAVWCRKLAKERNLTAFVDENTPVLSMAVLPEFRNSGVASAMMTQFLQEAGASFESLSANVLADSRAIGFYEKFGFVKLENSDKKSLIDGADIFTMVKKLEFKEVARPKDPYDATYWIE